MAGIEQAELHFFVGEHVSCHLRANLFPLRAALHEVIFDHPLLEGFSHYGPSIIDSKFFFDQSAMLVGGRGSDAIDHAVWEQAFLRHPIPEHRIPQLGKSDQHFLGYFTVALNVVAGHESEGRKPAYAPAIESLQEVPKRTGRFMRMSEIILKVRMLSIQLASCRLDVVSTFGNRQRNDAS
jgi:hypothetical protein